MKKVFSADNLIDAGHVRGLLEASGIACTLKNEYLGGGIGEIPAAECWIEVWVRHNRDYGIARRLIDEALYGMPERGRRWRCRRCGERLEPQFSHCWQCGGERPEERPRRLGRRTGIAGA